jgi:hypothetical protein
MEDHCRIRGGIRIDYPVGKKVYWVPYALVLASQEYITAIR